VTRPRLLDLFCGAGGAAMGYHRAGFDVVGVDIAPQPHYPFPFIRADALTYPLDGFDAVHASPPCQAYSRLRHLPWLRDRQYWDSVPPTRARLEESGVPWVMENVEGAPVDGIYLCGTMFGLAWSDGVPLYRHRLFESTLFMLAPGHPRHYQVLVPGPLLKHRGRLNNGGVGRGSKASTGRTRMPKVRGAMGAMGIDWMTGNELSQAIPPAYTEWIGAQLLASIEEAA